MTETKTETKYVLSLAATLFTLEQLKNSPAAQAPQIALAGRSNVGKSSLLNALAGRKSLAKVSATPGKTASVNLYLVNPGGFYLTDLPGYGYAQRSKTERQKWAALIQAYLRDTRQLKALAILLDCRLEPQDSDLELISFARSLRLPLLPILTKADKCNRQERAKRQKQWRDLLLGQAPILTSASGPVSDRLGLEQVWQELARLALA